MPCETRHDTQVPAAPGPLPRAHRGRGARAALPAPALAPTPLPSHCGGAGRLVPAGAAERLAAVEWLPSGDGLVV